MTNKEKRLPISVRVVGTTPHERGVELHRVFGRIVSYGDWYVLDGRFEVAPAPVAVQLPHFLNPFEYFLPSRAFDFYWRQLLLIKNGHSGQ